MAWGPVSYYFRSHHHPSNPLLYPQFNELDLGKVTAYDLVVVSECLRMTPHGLDRRVVKKQVERYVL
jgi:hypothetical protein